MPGVHCAEGVLVGVGSIGVTRAVGSGVITMGVGVGAMVGVGTAFF